MAEPVSVIDALMPAIRHTVRQLFQPFRLGVWVRLAVLGLLTAEFSGGGSGGQVSTPAGGGSRESGGSGGEFLPWPDLGIEALVLLLVAAGVLVLLLGLLLLYVSSVCRFILFDAVLRDRCRIREGFRRWHRAGWSYFLWQLALAAAVIVFLAVVIGGPLAIAFAAGVFQGSASPWGLIAVLVLVVLFLVIPVMIGVAVVALFTRDFVIPIMALEEQGILAGWKNFLPRLRADALGYLLYVLFKIVLAIGAAVLFGILTLLVIVFPLVLFGATGLILFLAGQAAGLGWNVFTVALAIMTGVIVLVVLLAIAAFISTPAVVFFQAYRIHFFAPRYARLQEALAAGPFNPEPPAPPAAVPA